jgi:hypothetical protein
MKREGMIAAVLMVCGLNLTSSALGQADLIEKTRLTQYKNIQVFEEEGSYYLRVFLTVDNRNIVPVGLKEGRFDVSYGPGRTRIGVARLNEEFEVGTSEFPLDVLVGPKNPATTERLLEIFNLVNDPAVRRQLNLVGQADVGYKEPRGWVYSQNFAVNWELVPAVTRAGEILP